MIKIKNDIADYFQVFGYEIDEATQPNTVKLKNTIFTDVRVINKYLVR
jgi:hypothetical protein